ncbi:uncharacterized protein LOC129241463 isoform X1 [Anastrepha obliqua]|uniref:uncharacterized protein LOC129241463 isoform X1 n=1 Tax=Anastrepha obliqua TaxID=95512 RepID=UPI00240A6D26|nr:uncharacterized protein LOC129241463 isoform X1 [Anastrepha obliqua]
MPLKLIKPDYKHISVFHLGQSQPTISVKEIGGKKSEKENKDTKDIQALLDRHIGMCKKTARRLATFGKRQQHLHNRNMPCQGRQQPPTWQGFVLPLQSEYITCRIVALFSHQQTTAGNTHTQATNETIKEAASKATGSEELG